MSVAPQFSFVPTFKLACIDPSAIRKSYDEGYFATALPPESKIKTVSGTCPIMQSYDTDSNNGIFTITDRSGLTTTIATSNQKAYQLFNSSGGNAPITGPCDWCRHECTHAMAGLPFRSQTVFLDVSGKEEKTQREVRIFWSEFFFCDYECSYAYYEKHISRSCEALYNQAEYLLNDLFRLQYPGRKLTAAADPMLLDINRGSLTYEQYKSTKNIYLRSPNVVLFPAKREYIERATA